MVDDLERDQTSHLTAIGDRATNVPGLAQRHLDATAVAAVDSQGMVDAVLAMPRHLKDGLGRCVDAHVDSIDCPSGMVVCAMGGSAIGGDLAAAVAGDDARRQIRVNRDYRPGAGFGPDAFVLAASYSGDTEETLECFEAASRTGAVMAAATTGGALARRAGSAGVPTIELPPGLQPRAAVGYMLVSALWCAQRAGASPPLGDAVVRAAAKLEARAREWSPDGPDEALPKALARSLLGTTPVIYGAELTAAVARRWKCQLNENAKVPAFFAELPEACHNEICGWEPAHRARLSAVFLDDHATHPRTRRRMELMADEVRAAGVPIVTVPSAGGTRCERLLTQVMLGDLMSVYTAVLNGVDPTPVDQIGRLKAELRQTAP